MTVEESADAAGTDSAASNSSMAATMPEEPIDQEYGLIHHQKVKIILRPPHRKN